MIDRRTFLAATGLGLLGAGMISACGSPGQAGGSGRLRIGCLISPTDSLDIGTISSAGGVTAAFNNWEMLAELRGAKLAYRLAESIVPDDTCTEWTATLRPDIKWHNGKPLTAEDVHASMVYGASTINFGSFMADVDLAASGALDDRTYRFVLARPRGDFLMAIVPTLPPIVFEGDPHNRVGTGPYRLDSFDAAEGVALTANDAYWDGRPSIGRLELLPIADPAARLKALQSGSIDYALSITPTGAESLGGGTLKVHHGGVAASAAMTIGLNARVEPFSDPELRKAVRMAVDRDALVKVVLRGNGKIGDDRLGLGMPDYDDSIPRTPYDPSAAKKVFKERGLTGFTLATAEIIPGLNAASELFAEQLAELGVEVDLHQQDPAGYFSDFTALAQLPALAGYYVNRPVAGALAFSTGSEALFTFGGYGTPEYDALLRTAEEAVGEQARQAALNACQQKLADEAADLIWGYAEMLAGSVTDLSGIELTQGAPVFGHAKRGT